MGIVIVLLFLLYPILTAQPTPLPPTPPPQPCVDDPDWHHGATGHGCGIIARERPEDRVGMCTGYFMPANSLGSCCRGPLPVQYADPDRVLPRCAISLFPITSNHVCPREPGRVYACEACRAACGTCPTPPSPPPPPASTGFYCGAPSTHCINGCGLGSVDDATMECYLDDNPDVDCLVNHELNGARCHYDLYGQSENRHLGCSSDVFSASPTGELSTSPTTSPSGISTTSSTPTRGRSSNSGIATTVDAAMITSSTPTRVRSSGATTAAMASTRAPVAPAIPSTTEQVTLEVATLRSDDRADQGGASSTNDDGGGPVPIPVVVGVGVGVCVLAFVICVARRQQRPTGSSVLVAVPLDGKGSRGWNKNGEDVDRVGASLRGAYTFRVAAWVYQACMQAACRLVACLHFSPRHVYLACCGVN